MRLFRVFSWMKKNQLSAKVHEKDHVTLSCLFVDENQKCIVMELLFKKEVYRIMGACFEVYKELHLGILANFGHAEQLEWKRYVNTI